MVDRGWRRSGTYCYKPDLLRSCCPQYTIRYARLFESAGLAVTKKQRLDALALEPSRSQRKALYRFNRAIEKGELGPHGEDDEVQQHKVDVGPAAQEDKRDKSKNKPKPRKMEFSLIDELHHVEYSYRLDNAHAPVHKFEVGQPPPVIFFFLYQFIEELTTGIDRASIIYKREVRAIQRVPSLCSQGRRKGTCFIQAVFV